MVPSIQYAKTSDGVSIAYWTLGEGSPFVIMPMPIMSHIQLEWENPAGRQNYERMAESRQIIRYDSRAAGLSDRSITDYSVEALVMDLETVVDRVGLERFDLLGPSRAGMVAVSYAAKHPHRISNLLLQNASTTDAWGSRALHATRQLVEQDWEFFVDTYLDFLMGEWSEGEKDRATSLMKASTSPEAILGFDSAFEGIDVSDLLGKVQAPTLVLQTRDMKFDGLAGARRLAAGIPDARLAITEGGPFAESAARIIDEFLGLEAPKPSLGTSVKRDVGGLVTILFTDVEGSTALTDRLGDAKARDLLREHERLTRDALKEHGGSEVKTMGDGFMASFSSATQALECAIALQKSFEGHSASAGERINVRIGLNAGEPIAEDDPGGRADLFGTAVNMAARITATAEGGEILASNVVRELAAGKEFLFNDRGETELRGFEDAVRLFEVSWSGGD